MKRYTRIITAALAALFTLAAVNAYAQVLPPEGEWPATTISADETVNLTGDVTITGIIKINSGKTLTINSNGAERIIHINASNNYNIDNYGTLKIIGTNGARIIFDGGSNFTVNANSDGFLTSDDALTAAPAYERGILLYNNGNSKLQMSYVTVQNYQNNKKDVLGLIQQYSTNGTILFDNCIFRRIKCAIGSALYVSPTGSVSIEISDCEFTENVNTYPSVGASIIRTNASSIVNLLMKNSRFHHNFNRSSH